MPAELFDLRIEFWIKPISAANRGAQIVNDHRFRNTT